MDWLHQVLDATENKIKIPVMTWVLKHVLLTCTIVLQTEIMDKSSLPGCKTAHSSYWPVIDDSPLTRLELMSKPR